MSATHFDRQSGRYLEVKATYRRIAADNPDLARLLWRKLQADEEAAAAGGDVIAAQALTETRSILFQAIETVTAEQLVKARRRRSVALAEFAATARRSGVKVKAPCTARTRRAPRLREHRARRRVARSSTSSSSPGEPGEPDPALAGHEVCPSCGHVLLWSNGQLICPNRGCGRGRVAG